jgi:UDP-hydrolysing UDP-N-acetyl-D-glucosamine 2-epimerase
VDEFGPDILLLQGDRGEMLAAAIAGAHANVPVVHMSGGDRSGSIDDSVRHAITKLAHFHLVTCDDSARRVAAMGEAADRIFVVGEPTLDVIRELQPLPPAVLSETFDVDLDRPLILAIFHPVTSEIADAADHMRSFLDALLDVGEQALVSYPNSDAGSRRVIDVIEDYRARAQSPLRFSRSMPHHTFLSLMSVASVMAGNSSSGIIEAPSFGLPVVNVGTRQCHRVRAENVLDVGYDRADIAAGLRTALSDSAWRKRARHCVNPYGDGHTAERTLDILRRIRLAPAAVAKWLPSSALVDSAT